MRKLTLPRWIKRNPRESVGLILTVALSASLLLFRINSLQAGPNKYEFKTLEALSSFPDFSRPLDFVYLGVSKLFSLVVSDLTALRLTSIVFALGTLLSVRYLLEYWLDKKIATIGTLVLATSFWFISIGRIGAPFIMPAFWLSTLLSLIALRQYTKKPRINNMLLLLNTMLGLYTPIFSLMVALVGFVYLKKWGIRTSLKKAPKLLGSLVLVSLAPLIYSFFKNINNLKEILGVAGLSYNPLTYLETVLRYISQILFRGTLDPSVSLGRLPLLDIFQIFMLALGVITLMKMNKSQKKYVLIAPPVLFVILISPFGFMQTKLSVLMPIIFIAMAFGIDDFIKLWLKGFPRNPIGRLVGIVICSLIISMSGYYNVNRYFVAWAKNPEVKASHKLN